MKSYLKKRKTEKYYVFLIKEGHCISQTLKKNYNKPSKKPSKKKRLDKNKRPKKKF